MDFQNNDAFKAVDVEPVGFRPSATPRVALPQIGHVIDVSGGASRISITHAEVLRLSEHQDATLAMAGQVGSQVKIKVGSNWLVANVRSLTSVVAGEDYTAEIDFLGEGDEERLTGRIYNFRRGVTSFPLPGMQVFPVCCPL